MKKAIIISVVIIASLGAFSYWVYSQSSQPVPGQKVVDLGRDHVPVDTSVEYNSNPPTSGSHLADWVKAGVYDSPQDDRLMVHSLEHGYVIMSYNCDRKLSTFNPPAGGQLSTLVYAHTEDESTPSGDVATPSASLPESFQSESCNKLVEDLKSVYDGKGKRKMIVVPRPNLDSRIALTAWGVIDKLAEFDQQRIEKFIDYYRDQGPEKTAQ